MSDLIRSEGAPVAAAAHWPHPQICVVQLAGDLDAATAPDLTSYLRDQTRTSHTHLVLDLAQVQFLASAGIGVILSAMHHADGIHGRLHLVGVTNNRLVAHVFDLCGLLPRLDIHDSLDELLNRPDHD